MFFLIVVIHVTYILHAGLVQGVDNFTSCIYNGDCTASTNLGLIDLNAAVQNKPYTATVAKPKATYHWKPCQDFSLAGITAGSIQQPAGSYSSDIGVHSQAFCDVIASSGKLRFNMMSKDYNKFTYVTCTCGKGNKLKFTNENPTNNFNFVFTSKACCPTSPPPSSHVTATISPGTVVLIAFFGAIIAYFTLGIVFQVGVRKAVGRERIPNVTMWAALPGLVKSGFIFTFTRGRKTGYEKI